MAIVQAETSGSGNDDEDGIIKSWFCDTEAEVYATIVAERFYNGWKQKSYNFQTRTPETLEDGFQLDIRFVGKVESADDEAANDDLDNAIWDFRPAFEKEPIESHWDIDNLVAIYNGTVDPKTKRVYFSPKVSAAAALFDTRGLLGAVREPGDLPNPLYGISESGWISMSGLATARITTTDTSEMLAGLGEVISDLPGNAPDYGVPEDRDWLKAPPEANEIGVREDGTRLHQITYNYMLSPKGGWPPGVYEFIEV